MPHLSGMVASVALTLGFASENVKTNGVVVRGQETVKTVGKSFAAATHPAEAGC